MTRVAVCALLAASIVPTAGAQTTGAAYPAAVARMYPVSTARAWADVRSVLKDAGFKIDVTDESGRFVVTQPIAIDAKRFGFTATDVVANATRGRVALHVFVPAFVEPARVYVGSTVTAELQDGRGQMLVYSPDAIGNWLFRVLSARLAAAGYLIPQQPERRAALARSLLGKEDDSCLARVQAGASVPAPNWIAPRKLHEVSVVYPRSAYVDRVERTLRVNASIGEDGFPWPIGVATGSTTDDFAVTALGSMSLWRFAPAMLDGCPAPMRNAVVEIGFTLR